MTAFTVRRAAVACVGVCVALGLLLAPTSGATASGIMVCVPTGQGERVLTLINGACPKSYTLAELSEEGLTGPTGSTGPAGGPIRAPWSW